MAGVNLFPMKTSRVSSLLLFVLAAALFGTAPVSATDKTETLANPLIDFSGHLELTRRVGPLREKRRLAETEFLRLASEPNTIVLDARSGPMFERLHIQGAVNLSFPDFNDASLAQIVPTKDTRILIYCNNNFLGSPVAMTSKVAVSSLNISTYVALASYGYTNVYELGPLLTVKTTVLPLAGTEIETAAPAVKTKTP